MIFIIITLVICILLFIYVIFKDKFSFINIKINNIEEKIKSTLIKRKNLLEESQEIIKKTLKTNKEIYIDFEELNNPNLSMIELDRALLIHVNEFYSIVEKYKKLNKNEDFKKIIYSIKETEDLLNAYKEYYNEVSSKYNKLISIFPINILSFIKRKKKKDFFDKKSINDNDYYDFKY